MQPHAPPGLDTMSPMPMANVATPPGMMGVPWGEPPRPGSGAILAMFGAVAILMLAGTIVLHARALIERPDFGFGGGNEPFLAWQRTMRVMGFAGSLLIDVGVFLSLLFGTWIAVRRHDLPEGVRRAMVVGPAALVGAWLIVVGVFGASSLFLFP